jgi:uncharacterized membrane protein
MRQLPDIVRYHPRLIAATLAGPLASAFVPAHYRPVVRALVGWNTGAWIYLLLMWWMMASAGYEKVRDFADREDESAALALITVTVAAIASVAAIVLELATAKGAANSVGTAGHVVFTSLTLLGSWLLVPTIFTVHYAHLWFSDDASPRALKFPDRHLRPDYWDFAYFAFTIAVASQTSDVAVMSKRMRRVTLAQSVLSFFFNLAVLGLSINIAAGLLGT